MTNHTPAYCHVCHSEHHAPGRILLSPANKAMPDGRTLPVAACQHHAPADVKAAYKAWVSGA